MTNFGTCILDKEIAQLELFYVVGFFSVKLKQTTEKIHDIYIYTYFEFEQKLHINNINKLPVYMDPWK